LGFSTQTSDAVHATSRAPAGHTLKHCEQVPLKTYRTARAAADDYERYICLNDHAGCTLQLHDARMIALLVPISRIAVSITSSSPIAAALR